MERMYHKKTEDIVITIHPEKDMSMIREHKKKDVREEEKNHNTWPQLLIPLEGHVHLTLFGQQPDPFYLEIPLLIC